MKHKKKIYTFIIASVIILLAVVYIKGCDKEGGVKKTSSISGPALNAPDIVILNNPL